MGPPERHRGREDRRAHVHPPHRRRWHADVPAHIQGFSAHPKEGLYKLTATINHSPTGDPAKVSEMFGFAEATPVKITNTVVGSN
jgi:hypothetical protein